MPKRTRYRRLLRAVLVVALVVATLLRFVGLGFGHGVLCPRPDEELIRSGVLISLTGDLNPHYAVWGHLFHYLYAAISAAWTAIRVWSGVVWNWTEAVGATHCDPGTFIWLGRALSATAGVLTLAATYQLARRALGSRLVAVGSCILLSTLFLHVRDSHFATCDMLLTLLSTCALAAMASPGRTRAGRAAVWTGLALATKLLAATVVLTFLTVSVGCRPSQPEERRWSHRLGEIVRFLAVAAAVTIVTQPFLLLDPMETWYGLFDDLFNPGRRPLEHGLHAINAAILVRYYVPQALGWVVGGLATVGGLFLVVRVVSERLRCRHRASLLAYVLWSILALVSVERIFLRYLDPLLPVTCVLAAFGIERICRTTARFVMRVHCRVGLTLACTLLAALPNLYRGIWLDHHLLQPDTRELARQWIEQNVPSGSRILWASHGV
ncbi:MAG: DUF2029 domain-containing protein, partial [Planctomycetes bacterium]|nr:DUF2029 domain-containing protein [Planctomycetota bacterium]